GFAVERRPDFGVGRVSAELLDDLVPQLPLHVAAGGLQFAMTAMNAGQIADRSIFNYKLWRGVMVVGAPAHTMQTMAARVILEQRKIRVHYNGLREWPALLHTGTHHIVGALLRQPSALGPCRLRCFAAAQHSHSFLGLTC